MGGLVFKKWMIRETHLMPRHWRDPLPKATKYRSRLVPSLPPSSQRSGRNDSGSGNTVGSRRTKVDVSDTGVYVEG